MSRFLWSCVSLLTIAATPAALAESWTDQFRGDDNWFDMSDWVLNNAVGFMPVPLVITEPAVGAGLGAGLVFFHPPKDYSEESFEERRGGGEFVLPNITAVAAAYTDNESWMVGGGHLAHWRDDKIRYDGLLGYASINLKFFGDSSDSGIFDDGLGFNAKGLFIQQPLAFRMGRSNFFLGAEWDYLEIETRFDLGTGIPEIDELTFDAVVTGFDVFMTYDTRDNKFTPNSGIEAEVSMGRKDDLIGSDFEYDALEARYRGYRQLGSKLVIGARLETETVDGDVPFFLVPFIGMRGIPAMRYQGQSVIVGEVEARFAVHPRISAVGFVGAGRAANSYGDLGGAPSRVARGLGVRYFIADKLGVHVGIDVAEGPEDTHYYLTMGSAWSSF